MPYPYIDTPRTEVDGNATYLTNGYRSAGRTHLSALDSVENSFQSPSKDEDIVKDIEDGRKRDSGGFKLTTPRAGMGPKTTKNALNDRRQFPGVAPAKGEFTPLMQSATKNNMMKNMSAARGFGGGGGPKTPSYLRSNHRSNGNTPGLPEMSGIHEDDATDDQATPVPQIASSSAQSTPLPMLPGRDGGGVLSDGQNMMTLKEQEKVIDKFEKDNFGLKLKIHYLQEQLEKAGPAYNQTALKENTELKVAKLTMQRDVSRYKKGLLQAERDLQSYRLQVQDLREKNRKRQTDGTAQYEVDSMRQDIDMRDAQIKSLQNELRDVKSEHSEGIEKLRDEIEDLEATVREKDRNIDQRDEEIEELKDKDSNERNAVSDLEAELDRAKEQLKELQESLDQSKAAAKEARDAEKRAVEEKGQAEEDLRELHEEMANKSFSTKGFNRQLEEKASKLEEELHEVQRGHHALSRELETKTQHTSQLEEHFRILQQDMDVERTKLKDAVEQASRGQASAQQESQKASERLQEVLDDIQRGVDEKELLQTRHRALTDESGSLQRELSDAHTTIRGLQGAIEDLNTDLSSKRQMFDEQRSELLSAKEELRVTKREETALKDKVQTLEDEITVLQASLEEEQEYGKSKLREGASDLESQLQKSITDRQSLREQLANAHVELRELRASIVDVQVERDELQEQLSHVRDEVDDTHRFDLEKVELRKSSLRLQSELSKLKDDKLSLADSKESLEKQLNSEIGRATEEESRLSTEIDRLQAKVLALSSGRDRELTSAKSKAQRLERRIHDVEALLEQQPPVENEISVGNGELSGLRHSLDEARKREKSWLQNEADQKAYVRTCKSRIAELERELHNTVMRKFEAETPQFSPSDKLHEEIRNLRKQLSDAHRALRELKTKNRELERAALREEDQKDLHELLKTSTLEAEALSLKLSERDGRLDELKAQARRIREERAFCVKKAETASKGLEVLQARYDQVVDQLSTTGNKSKHEKEMRGLGKEIVWLRARLRREQRFRHDLAWSKGLMELGERVRVACNQADLRMVAEMGIKPHDRSEVQNPRQKLKRAISTVLAVVRIRKMAQKWEKTKKLGEGLKRAKSDVQKRRDSKLVD